MGVYKFSFFVQQMEIHFHSLDPHIDIYFDRIQLPQIIVFYLFSEVIMCIFILKFETVMSMTHGKRSSDGHLYLYNTF